MKNEEIARITHEADRAIRSSMGQEILGWDRLDATLKSSWRSKVASLRGSDKITPKLRHELWVKDMIESGWSLGTAVDHDNKTHPSICSYENLPDEVHLLDNVFVAIVDTCTSIGRQGGEPVNA